MNPNTFKSYPSLIVSIRYFSIIAAGIFVGVNSFKDFRSKPALQHLGYLPIYSFQKRSQHFSSKQTKSHIEEARLTSIL